MQLKQKLQIDVSASKSQKKKWTWAYVTSETNLIFPSCWEDSLSNSEWGFLQFALSCVYLR